MNGIHQAYADEVSLIGDDIRRNADVLLNGYEDIGLAVNTRKTKYMVVGRLRDMISNEHIRINTSSY